MFRINLLYLRNNCEKDDDDYVNNDNLVLVTTEEIRAWCEANGNLPFLETSAKSSSNVEEAFHAAVDKLLSLEAASGNPVARHANNNTVQLNQNSSKSACC